MEPALSGEEFESINWFKNEALPDFTGEDPIAWIIIAERFFEEQNIHWIDRVQWAFMRMDGAALLWFADWCQENFNADWKSFSLALIQRFGNSIESKVILEDTKKESEPSIVTVTIEGSVPEPMEKTVNGIIETNSSKIGLVPEKIVEIMVKKNEMVIVEGQREKGMKEKFEAAVETPPPKSFSSPPDLPWPPPEPPDSGRSATVCPKLEPSDLGSHTMTILPRQEPPPKSPYLSDSMGIERKIMTRTTKDWQYWRTLSLVRAEVYGLGDDVRWKEREACSVLLELGQILNLLGLRQWGGRRRDQNRNHEIITDINALAVINRIITDINCAVTNASKVNAKLNILKLGLLEFFDGVVTDEERQRECGKRHVSSLHSSTCAFIVVTTPQMLTINVTTVSYLFPFNFGTSTFQIPLFPILFNTDPIIQHLHYQPHHFHNIIFALIMYWKLYEYTGHAFLLAWFQDRPFNLTTSDFLMIFPNLPINLDILKLQILTHHLDKPIWIAQSFQSNAFVLYEIIRKNLTDLKVYTNDVDEADAPDDALSATKLQDGWIKIWAHVSVNPVLPASVEVAEESDRVVDRRVVSPKDFIAAQFPNFSLEDKVGSHGGGNDSKQGKSKGKFVIREIYERRN